MFVPPAEIDATVEAEAWLPAKAAALRALPSQVTVLDDRPGRAVLALSNDVPQPLTGTEQRRSDPRRADVPVLAGRPRRPCPAPPDRTANPARRRCPAPGERPGLTDRVAALTDVPAAPRCPARVNPWRVCAGGRPGRV